MRIRVVASLSAAVALTTFIASPALAQSSVKVGTLTCDVSAGIGMLITQKQTMTCSFSPADGGPPDNYVGRIDQFGLALGEVQQGTMVWGVLAPSSGFPHGALAGSYGGVGAQAARGAGLGVTSWSAEPAARFPCSLLRSKVRPDSTSPRASQP